MVAVSLPYHCHMYTLNVRHLNLHYLKTHDVYLCIRLGYGQLDMFNDVFTCMRLGVNDLGLGPHRLQAEILNSTWF
jgi:hypothetical protein